MYHDEIININVLERDGDPDRVGTIHEGRTSQLAVESGQIAAISQAELDTKISEILRPIEEQKVQIEHMQKEQELQHEQFLAVLRVSGEAFQELASVLTQAQMTPGLHHDLDNRAIDMMLTGLDNLTRSITSGGMEINRNLTDDAPSDNLGPDDGDPDVLPAMDMDHVD